MKKTTKSSSPKTTKTTKKTAKTSTAKNYKPTIDKIAAIDSTVWSCFTVERLNSDGLPYVSTRFGEFANLSRVDRDELIASLEVLGYKVNIFTKIGILELSTEFGFGKTWPSDDEIKIQKLQQEIDRLYHELATSKKSFFSKFFA